MTSKDSKSAPPPGHDGTGTSRQQHRQAPITTSEQPPSNIFDRKLLLHRGKNSLAIMEVQEGDSGSGSQPLKMVARFEFEE